MTLDLRPQHGGAEMGRVPLWCATLRQYVHQSTIEFQQIRERMLSYEKDGIEELLREQTKWQRRDQEKTKLLDQAREKLERLEKSLQVSVEGSGIVDAEDEKTLVGKQELNMLRSTWKQWQTSQVELESKLEAKVQLVQSIQDKMNKIESKYNQQLSNKEAELKKWQGVRINCTLLTHCNESFARSYDACHPS
eukprot:1025323-Prorocentrum_minimum.AAC.2